MSPTTASTKKDQHAESSPEVAASGAQAPKPNAPSDCKLGNVSIEFDQIQGNIFGGFLKDHQVNILLEVKAKGEDDARQTLLKGELPTAPDSIISHVKHSTSKDVIAFNEQFRAIRHAGLPEGSILATWTNIVFTESGMKKFGASTTSFPKAFTDRMEKREIGDLNDNAPAHWSDGMDVSIAWDHVDVMIMIASDDPAEMDRLSAGSRLAKYLGRLNAPASGFNILGIIRGETRVDAGLEQVGHEHFGFKDGVSQPGIRGVDSPDDSLHNPDQGNPGQDLLHPGEFVLGYPRQIPSAKAGVEGPNPCQGKIAGKEFETTDPKGSQVVLPVGAKNGSFLVFRRLAQDVKGFRDAVVQNAGTLGLTTDLLGAKLVGRYRSGAPLEALKFQSGIGEYQPPENDPGAESANPALANSNALNNAFEYGEDLNGDLVPLAAHIRKAYPRDGTGDESDVQTHRLLRRGIPFGRSLGAAESGGPDDSRGLLFFAYQSDIERQFEFVQNVWVNNENFPNPGAGQDPIITNSSPKGAISGCPFHALADKSKCPAITFTHFVKTRGGGYFFSPSTEALKSLVSGEPLAGETKKPKPTGSK